MKTLYFWPVKMSLKQVNKSKFLLQCGFLSLIQLVNSKGIDSFLREENELEKTLQRMKIDYIKPLPAIEIKDYGSALIACRANN